jgi:hypothetical protein
MMTNPVADQTHYVVVLAAETDARFQGEAIPMRINGLQTNVGQMDVIFRTRWSEEGSESPIPREMWIDARGTSEASLDEAATVYANTVASLLTLIALGTNAAVGDPE